MSLIRKNDEHWRDNVIGLTFNKRLENEIMKRHNTERLAAVYENKLLEYRKTGKIDFEHQMSEGAFCTAIHHDKISDIGFNCVDDLLTNNFWSWFGGIVKSPSIVSTTAGYNTVALTDIANTSRTVRVYGGISGANTFGTFNAYTSGDAFSVGTQIQLGSGSTAAVLADYNIETAFGTAPESGRFSTGAGGAGGGAISFSGAISAGGADTVNEMGWFGCWIYLNGNTSTLGYFLLCHDILSSGVAFVAGDTLNASYSIT